MVLQAHFIMNLKHVQFSIRFSAFFAAAVIALMIPAKWLLASCTAALIHELSHILAVVLCNGSIDQIEMKMGGIQIHTGTMTKQAAVICIAAGPIASLMLACLMPICPKLAFCGLLQGVYNLIPIGALDGARIVKMLREKSI